MSNRGIITRALEQRSTESRRFVSKSMDIVYRIHDMLKEKGWTQKMLAIKIGKKESEVSNMLTRPHNFTLRTLAKLEAALETDLYLPAKSRGETHTISLKIHNKAEHSFDAKELQNPAVTFKPAGSKENREFSQAS